MTTPVQNVRAALSAIVEQYQQRGDVPRLLEQLITFAETSPTDGLLDAVEQYREMHEVAGPIYEVLAERLPNDAMVLVKLANAYWLTGRGPEVVGELASRALAADPQNRGAWHLWALTETSPRQRTQRWQQVTARFPDDQLAKANLADNAAALAGAENDTVALKLAIVTYESLLESATSYAQRAALGSALKTLRNWKA